jgi:NAD(P)-dependent dehydrogenase (short-subunit alcohol dehydrogenase family)
MAVKKVALVTGANRGIGLETVRQLAAQGMTVLLGARDEKKGMMTAEKLKREGLDVDFLLIDIDDPETHQAAFEYIRVNHGKLDILVNNAAVSIDSQENGSFVPASVTTIETLRGTFETNVFGTIALTRALLPLIQRADAGRIVFLSSLLGSLTLQSDPSSPFYGFKPTAYDLSKSALNAYVVHLAYELRGTPIKVNAAHPGSVLTDMNPHGAIPVEVGAQTSVELATLPADGPTGKFIHLGEEYPW